MGAGLPVSFFFLVDRSPVQHPGFAAGPGAGDHVTGATMSWSSTSGDRSQVRGGVPGAYGAVSEARESIGRYFVSGASLPCWASA